MDKSAIIKAVQLSYMHIIAYMRAYTRKEEGMYIK